MNTLEKHLAKARAARDSKKVAEAARLNGLKGGRPSAQYAIVITRYYNGPVIKKGRVVDVAIGCEWRGTRKQAKAFISEQDSKEYCLVFNEYARPKFSMVKA